MASSCSFAESERTRKIGQERGFDIYDLVTKAKNLLSYQQKRIISDTKQVRQSN